MKNEHMTFGTTMLSRKYTKQWMIGLCSVFLTAVLLLSELAGAGGRHAQAAGLPTPWANGDIGNVGLAGSASYDNGVYSVTGSSIIEYTYDKFHFVYQPLYGDGTIVARVASLSGGTSGAKAGVMIRNDLNAWPPAVNAMVQVSANASLSFQRRVVAGEQTSYTSLSGSYATPYWLKLTRQGNTITSFASADGSNWTQVGAEIINNLAVDAWVGLAVASGSDSATATATFDNVSVTQPTVAVNVDWSTVKSSISSLAYGTNGYSALDVNVMADPNYTNGIASSKAAVVRLHYAGLLNDSAADSRGWVDVETTSWDKARIATIMDGVVSWNTSKAYKPTILVNIPGFPSWLPTYSVTDPANNNAVVTDNLLATNQFDAYATFCADLVRILNIEQKRGIKYFELPNESDNNYNQHIVDYNNSHGTNFPNKMGELADLYNRAARAMKQVDPTIRVGGPALQRPDTIAGVTTFIQNTVNQNNPRTLDFFTIHGYASGSASDSDSYIYNRVYNPAAPNSNNMLADIIKVRQALDTASSGRRVPLWLDEYNISWTYETFDVRMKNHKGVVFDALSAAYFLSNGVDVLASWNDADGIYGKLDPAAAYQLRPGGQFLRLMNLYARGSRVAVTTSVDNTVVPFAVKTSTRLTYILINRSPNTRQVSTTYNGGPSTGTTYTLNQFTETGFASRSVSGVGSLTLPPHSVTLLTKAV